MKVYARAVCLPAQTAPGPALLLEGSWTQPVRPPCHVALDDWLRPEHREIDRLAEALADRLAHGVRNAGDDGSRMQLGRLADTYALSLRYYLVKLLRTAAYLAEHPFAAGSTVCLRCDPQRDLDYAALLLQATLRDKAVLQIEHASCSPIRPATPVLRRASWRRLAGRLANGIADRRLPPSPAHRVLLCGTPHVLGTVCDALLGRGHEVAWLHEQFVWRTARKWSWRGVRQILCDARGSPQAPRIPPVLEEPVSAYGIDLRPALQTWFDARCDTCGDWMESVAAQIEGRLQDLAPHALVVDEDATPFKRLLLRAARRRGTPSLVVQHGIPCVRFGFVPLAADKIAVWGESSRAQLVGWGVPADQVVVSGCTIADPPVRPVVQSSDFVLLLATAPPRADRPDSVAFGLSVAAHAAMLRAAGQVVAQRGLRLLVRLHPRTTDADAVLGPLAQIAGLEVEVLRGGDLCDHVRSACCVLSCASSSGVQAAAAGVPVIQLMPPGGADLLPAAAWGFQGTARTCAELESLFEAVLRGTRTPAPRAPSCAAQGAAAAERVVDELQGLIASYGLRRPLAGGVPVSASFGPHGDPSPCHEDRLYTAEVER